jgi:predicted peptidase
MSPVHSTTIVSTTLIVTVEGVSSKICGYAHETTGDVCAKATRKDEYSVNVRETNMTRNVKLKQTRVQDRAKEVESNIFGGGRLHILQLPGLKPHV